MIDLAIFAACIAGAAFAALRIGASQQARRSEAFWQREYPHIAAATKQMAERGHPLSPAAPALLVCDSCDGTMLRHNPACPRITGRELAPIVDLREVRERRAARQRARAEVVHAQ